MSNLIETHQASVHCLEAFFATSTPTQVEKQLTHLLHTAIASPDADAWPASERADAIFVVQLVAAFVSDLHAIHSGDIPPNFQLNTHCHATNTHV